MAQAVVTIAGRTYRMNCDEGEEPHIEQLALQVDSKIAELRGAFGEIGDQRIVVMAALTLADELFAIKKKLAEKDEALAARGKKRRSSKSAGRKRPTRPQRRWRRRRSRSRPRPKPSTGLERFQAKWTPVGVKKTRKKNKDQEPDLMQSDQKRL